jgi:hypothetical protein
MDWAGGRGSLPTAAGLGLMVGDPPEDQADEARAGVKYRISSSLLTSGNERSCSS